MTHYENDAAQDDADERYYVTLDNGQVELMTLEELDGAFQADRITQDSLVCRVGDTAWQPLSALAGLDEEEESSAAQPDLAPAPHGIPSAIGTMGRENPAAPSFVAPAAAVIASPAPVAPYPAVPSQFPASAAQHSLAPTVSPVSSALDDLDLDALALRPKRKKAVVFGVVAVAAAAIAAVGVFGASGETSAAAATPSPAITTAAPAATPAPAPASTEAVAKKDALSAPASKGDKAADGEGDRLTEDVKNALLKSDQARDSKSKKKKKQAASQARGKRGGSSTGFRSSGSAYDPLNGKL